LLVTSALVRYDKARDIPFEELGWPGKRFRAMEAVGEPMDIWFSRYDRNTQRVVEQELIRHESHDGVGAMTAILEDRGFTVPEMPTMRRAGKKPGKLRRLLLLLKYIGEIRGWASIWQKEPAWETRNEWPAAAIALFDRDRTAAYEKALRAQGSATTAGILSSLDKHAAARLLTPESPRRWMVPVNMRVDPGERVYGNKVTSILVPFPTSLNPREVHAEIKRMLAANYHWGTLIFSDFAQRYDEARVTRMMRRFDPRRTIFGFVTNVGEWPPPGAVPPSSGGEAVGDANGDAQWTVTPPVGRRGPLACAMLTWKGQLSVTLKVHGCLGLAAADVRAILADVAKDVELVAGGAGSGVVFTDEKTASSAVNAAR